MTFASWPELFDRLDVVDELVEGTSSHEVLLARIRLEGSKGLVLPVVGSVASRRACVQDWLDREVRRLPFPYEGVFKVLVTPCCGPGRRSAREHDVVVMPPAELRARDALRLTERRLAATERQLDKRDRNLVRLTSGVAEMQHGAAELLHAHAEATSDASAAALRRAGGKSKDWKAALAGHLLQWVTPEEERPPPNKRASQELRMRAGAVRRRLTELEAAPSGAGAVAHLDRAVASGGAELVGHLREAARALRESGDEELTEFAAELEGLVGDSAEAEGPARRGVRRRSPNRPVGEEVCAYWREELQAHADIDDIAYACERVEAARSRDDLVLAAADVFDLAAGLDAGRVQDCFIRGVLRILKRSRGTVFLDVGKPFDASRHVAVESMESGVVAHCVGVGALLEGRVLRRAAVALRPADDGGAAEARSALAQGLSELADDAECEATGAGILFAARMLGAPDPHRCVEAADALLAGCSALTGPDAHLLMVCVSLVLGEIVRLGAEPLVPAVGAPFDVAEHEAVAADGEMDGGACIVTELVGVGLRLEGQVVRPARVRVASAEVDAASAGLSDVEFDDAEDDGP